jgi:hypothetical protein
MPSNATVTTVAGSLGSTAPFLDGIGTTATFNAPEGVALNSAGTLALVVS